MSVSSKTGLTPIQKRFHKQIPSGKRKQQKDNPLLDIDVARKIKFSIRPFDGLYNPYSKCCSVLCNHPAPVGIRQIIKQVRDSWSVDGKNANIPPGGANGNLHGPENIPEDLFRRYTDTDSRPLTPSPTSTSIRTKVSANSFLNTRRCVTPEPGKDGSKRKKLILDLRRSHSQETVYWKTTSEISQNVPPGGDTVSNLLSVDGNESNYNKSEKSKQNKLSENLSVIDNEDEEKPNICINEQDLEENGLSQRRGKKRKKAKQQQVQAAPAFHLSEDPETQIATLGLDSLNASTRPSLIATSSAALLSEMKTENVSTLLKDSFLTVEVFSALKTELDVDVIENTFERYLNRARKEAFKYLTPKSKDSDSSNTRQDINYTYQKGIESIPRRLSKSSSRFEMPLDIGSVLTMTPLEYLSKYVWISKQRKQLYKSVFVKYVCKEDHNEDNILNQNEYVDRRMAVGCCEKALKEMLGFYGTEKSVREILDLLDINSNCGAINFRTWCGIMGFAERYVVPNPQETDSCDELEKTDFDTVEERLEGLTIASNVNEIFKIIRKGHNIR